MQTARILILEPDLYDFYDAQKCLADLALVFQATTVDQAWHLIKASDFDLIIFELNLPSSTGFEFCTELKSRAGTRDLPLICASNLNDVTEKVIAFSLGVDDYITKPFIPQEFRARIESKLRKRIQSPNLRFQGLRISLVHQRTEIEANGQMIEIELTPLEFRLLAFLAQNKERVLSRAVILQAVWGDACTSLIAASTRMWFPSDANLAFTEP